MTGVQTCALPIWTVDQVRQEHRRLCDGFGDYVARAVAANMRNIAAFQRRVADLRAIYDGLYKPTLIEYLSWSIYNREYLNYLNQIEQQLETAKTTLQRLQADQPLWLQLQNDHIIWCSSNPAP